MSEIVDDDNEERDRVDGRMRMMRRMRRNGGVMVGLEVVVVGVKVIEEEEVRVMAVGQDGLKLWSS